MVNRASIRQEIMKPGLKRGGRIKKKKKLDIKKAIKKPGALRKSLGIKKGKTIPKSVLNKAAKAPGKLGQRARFAKTLKKLRKKKRRG
jgi:hypothetical protein|tara:strand:+ start:720 stop:983 length:264 start_codon:yes stop_codon:yes gene_type:complete